MTADPPPAPRRFLEDVRPGDAWRSQPVPVSAEDIIGFAGAYDPQPMHLDPEAAAKGPFGGLIASGWHIAALTMRQIVEARPYGDTPIIGLGVDELRWRHPVRPGDSLTISATVAEVARSRSKPDRGTVRTHMSVENQHGETVMSLTTLVLVPARGAG